MKKLFALLALLAMTTGFVSVNAGWGIGKGGSTKQIVKNEKARQAAPAPTAAQVAEGKKAAESLRDRRFWN